MSLRLRIVVAAPALALGLAGAACSSAPPLTTGEAPGTVRDAAAPDAAHADAAAAPDASDVPDAASADAARTPSGDAATPLDGSLDGADAGDGGEPADAAGEPDVVEGGDSTGDAGSVNRSPAGCDPANMWTTAAAVGVAAQAGAVLAAVTPD
jgi:hypothetical protein